VEKEDPWVRDVFGVSGTGEGLVYYPVAGLPDVGSRWALSTFAFKAKGEKHRVKAATAAVEVAPEKLASAAAFTEAFVTQARLEQALAEAAGDRAEITSIGPFLAWIGQDIKKEGADELEASELEWKDVSKSVQAAARSWFLDEVRKAAEAAPSMAS